MPCPASPEGGFHRYQLAPQGDGRPYATCCLYCAEEKIVRPSERAATRWDSTARAGSAASAAKRRKGAYDG